MLQSDFLYGCRSGIQKGVRRGDLDLVHTCFEALWEENDQHRDWLKWRSWSITIEECFHMIGELAKLLETGSYIKADWKKFLFRLCIATKSKDAPGLWSFIHSGGDSYHPEYKEIRYFRQHAERELAGDFLKVIPLIHAAYRKGSDTRILTKYEKKALDVLLGRAQGGGMINDRYFTMSAMIILFLRGLDEDAVIEDLKFGRERWVKKVNGRTKPKTVNLPWYVFDKHTQVGRQTSGILCGRWNRRISNGPTFSQADVEVIWSYLESYRVGKDMIRYKVEDPKKPTALDSIWWVELLKRKLTLRDGLGPRECAEVWKKRGLSELAQEITWEIIDKRNVVR